MTCGIYGAIFYSQRAIGGRGGDIGIYSHLAVFVVYGIVLQYEVFGLVLADTAFSIVKDNHGAVGCVAGIECDGVIIYAIDVSCFSGNGSRPIAQKLGYTAVVVPAIYIYILPIGSFRVEIYGITCLCGSFFGIAPMFDKKIGSFSYFELP